MRILNIFSVIFIICILYINIGHFRSEQKITTKNLSTLVPDSETAVKIAEAVIEPVYGTLDLLKHKPYKAVLKNNTWEVRGTMLLPFKGGTAVVQIARKDGRILSISHEE